MRMPVDREPPWSECPWLLRPEGTLESENKARHEGWVRSWPGH